jgi:hypothetical protein
MKQQPRVLLLDSETKDFKAAIDQSPLYCCFVSHKTIDNAMLRAQLYYAAACGKPIRVFVLVGTPIPAGMFAPLPDCEVFIVENPAQMADITVRLIREMRQEKNDA